MRKNDSLAGAFDWPLFSVFMVLMGFGLATVYSVAYD
ncbi:MAG: cell division protein FtsW (lipid II flippase), partial [Flavobacteriaceae bacterium]